MDASFPLTQTRCRQQVAGLTRRGAGLSMALGGCMRTCGSRTTTSNTPAASQGSSAGGIESA